MGKEYIHLEVETHQTPKRPAAPCGDVVSCERTPSSTTLLLCDGIGSGIKANIAATMCSARLLELLRRGYSLRNAFASLVKTMNEAKGTGMPYAAFTVARVLNDGVASALTYEMPAPLFVTRRYADVLRSRTVTLENSLIGEANFHLSPGEGLLLVCDGITQAGLGAGYAQGWGIEGAARFVADSLRDGTPLHNIPRQVVRQAHEISRGTAGDDCTAVLGSCRWGTTVNILTGPPGDRKLDEETVKRFLRREGVKIVCGGTTSAVVARCLGREVFIEENPQSLLAPPRDKIEGIGLVTEGAVTLNQLYNILDEDPADFEEVSGVTELHALVLAADRVNFLVGGALNPATNDLAFRQQGILGRRAIIPLIAKKLEEAGKLVVVEAV